MNTNDIFKRYADDIFSGSTIKKAALTEERAAVAVDEFLQKEELRKLVHKEKKYMEIIGTHPDFAYLENDSSKNEYHYAVSVFLDIKGSTLLGAKLPLEDVRIIKNNIITNAIEFFQVFDGHIQRIQGDAVFAIFGRRGMKRADAIIDALNASALLQYYFDTFVSVAFDEKGFPPVKTRIGIDFGNDDKVLWSKYGIQNCSEVTTTSIHTDLAAKLQAKAHANGIMLGDNIIKFLDFPDEFYRTKRVQLNNEEVEDKYVIENNSMTYRMWVFEWKKYVQRFHFLKNIEGCTSNLKLQCFYSNDGGVEKEYITNCGSLNKEFDLRFKLNINSNLRCDEITWRVSNRGQEATQNEQVDFEMIDSKNKAECLQRTAYKGHHYMSVKVKYQGGGVESEKFGIYVCDE